MRFKEITIATYRNSLQETFNLGRSQKQKQKQEEENISYETPKTSDIA